MPQMKLPGPDHPITIEAEPRRMQVIYQGHVVVDSQRAISLREALYKPVLYFPREDASMPFFTRTEQTTYCPYKGVANYYSLAMDGQFAENAVWTYEDPYPAMALIRGCLAFYPHNVEVVAVDEPLPREAVRDIVEHTDSGAGSSQLEHWKPNAT
ncbi:MAG: DUF427 domain-containing protein [Caulobacterales bacterium]